MATRSSILVWTIPWWRSLAGYSAWGGRVRHDWGAEQALGWSPGAFRLSPSGGREPPLPHHHGHRQGQKGFDQARSLLVRMHHLLLPARSEHVGRPGSQESLWTAVPLEGTPLALSKGADSRISTCVLGSLSWEQWHHLHGGFTPT